mmetsp:Transcript_20196/g.3293  ORF Transcript_20196/g.3293 Transcript_20196/m.3293 type:complete len:94 (+) Transcript_20196:29-310(+)
MREPGTLNHCPFSLKQLKRCDIFVLDRTSIFYLRNCHQCNLHAGPVSAAIYIENCTDCDISVSCHRLRVYNSKRLKIYCHTSLDPNIDKCEDV